MYTPLISVIVAIYNTENDLERCINSVLKQTYYNFELLLIDDGSTDRSGEICDKFIHIDKRIRVFHKENGGASSARNLGIDVSKGSYICFIDSDDYVEENYLAVFLTNSLEKDKTTLIIQSLVKEVNGVNIQLPRFSPGLYSFSDFSILFTNNNISLHGYTVCKLYNRDIIEKNKIRFDLNVHYSEDLLFLFSYICYVDNVHLLSTTQYHYIDKIGSLSKKYHTYESEILGFNLLNEYFKKITIIFNLNKDAQNNIQENSLGFLLWRSITTMYRPFNKKKYKERILILKKLNTFENITYLQKYLKKSLKLNQVIFLLYMNKWFSLFDILYKLIYSLRYKFDKQWKNYNKQLK
ncbi:MAG: glycosyltransferase family 2 protein [Tissierellia bacterium]|nr:glycosyltransferase family 2 protein [Tissierellia bacterium]